MDAVHSMVSLLLTVHQLLDIRDAPGQPGNKVQQFTRMQSMRVDRHGSLISIWDGWILPQADWRRDGFTHHQQQLAWNNLHGNCTYVKFR
jgi:hypothetical protein